jgi:hypothetical protein
LYKQLLCNVALIAGSSYGSDASGIDKGLSVQITFQTIPHTVITIKPPHTHVLQGLLAGPKVHNQLRYCSSGLLLEAAWLAAAVAAPSVAAVLGCAGGPVG